MPDAFRIKSLTKYYGPRRVLDIEDMSFTAGRITAIVGPNGCGKTTLLECLNGLLKPDSGEIEFFGAPLTKQSRKRMTMVLQAPYLFHGTVEYNVAYGPRLRGKPDPKIVAEAIKSVRLDGFEKRPARRLSVGESRRVAIARALAVSPDALILDEPTANIDMENTTVIENNIVSLNAARNLTVIFSTHSGDQALRVAHQVFQLRGGRPAPYYQENNFQALLTVEGGKEILMIGDKNRAVLATGLSPGPVFCAIPSEEIVVSSKAFHPEFENVWRGVLTSISSDVDCVKIVVDAGIPLTAKMTNRFYNKLRPALGDTLFLAFKPSSIRIDLPPKNESG